MSSIGALMSAAIRVAEENGEVQYTCLVEAERGMVYGMAFRAAELAYDLGQQHARKALWNALTRPMRRAEEERAARDRAFRTEQERAEREGLRLALDTRD